MQSSNVSWAIPLGGKPAILGIGIGTHGSVPRAKYFLAGLWCIHFYRHPAELSIAGHRFVVRPGDVGITPPSVDIEYHFLASPWNAAYAHFSLPHVDEGPAAIAALQSLGDDFETYNERFNEALRYSRSQIRRSEIKLWDILLDLQERTPVARANGAPIHPAVQTVLELIEMRLSEPIGVEEIAGEAGVSYTHLARLFQHGLQTTVAGHIRQRRVERAKHLLLNTTIPIKEIAAMTGIPDLHTFNKTIRRDLHRSPTDVRRGVRE